MVLRGQITGLILAGGQGSRLGGVDKGLQRFAGLPLAQHALQRLAPQVSRVMISANRNLEAYRQMGVPVWPDPPELQGYQGPLAGVLAGLQECDTAYIVTVPCDCPRFPSDLVQRLSASIGDAELAIARTSDGLEPAFCLMRRSVQDSLAHYLQSGQRKIERWTTQLRRVEVSFDEPAAFFNINTPDDLT